MMTSKQVRQSFLDFFQSKQHVIVPSSPVVLPADPTLLFANAGMNQFKEIFLGARVPTDRRVADTQKCIRVRGKHNDLEEVGRDTYHHTFFEMLGNWSFGDYYKTEAIQWAWELLTGVWGLPKDRLWVTVYKTDDEAAQLWSTRTDVRPDHILRFGDKENFWEMGETGPCGPCSEIHMDLTPGGCSADMVNAGLPEVMELWNLVFMQYNRTSSGHLEDLPSKHVDTGMGFERVTAVIQGKRSNYDSDIFMPLIEAVRSRCGKAYEGEDAVAMRVIADHLRALSFAIADGVLPSNEGRGYVLRRLLRRAARFGRRLGLKPPFLPELLPTLIQLMGDAFPELPKQKSQVERALASEEESFATTLDRGITLFEEVTRGMARRGEKVFPGDQAFKLYDTYGFPGDLTRLMATEKGLTLDEAGFESSMEEQRSRARAARKTGNAKEQDAVAALIARGMKSSFTGYDRQQDEGTVLALLREGAEVPSLGSGEQGWALLNATPFYGESGGQAGDTGLMSGVQGEAEVTDTQKPAEGVILHQIRMISGKLAAGDGVKTTVNSARRRGCMAHHSATHLLNAALRKFVSPNIRQAGSQVTHDRLRFDFAWFEAVTPEALEQIEAQVNEWISENHVVRTRIIPLKEIAGTDIIAVFDEKYGEQVRVVEVEGISRELCGGTHAAQTGQIAIFRIVSEGSVAAGVRRIEAMCGFPAYEWSRREHALVKNLCRKFSATEDELAPRIEALMEQNKQMDRELRKRDEAAALSQVDTWAAQMQTHAGIPLIAVTVGEMSADALKAVTDALRAKAPEAVVVLGATCEGKALFSSLVPDALAKKIHAGKLVGQVAKIAGGGGGGQPTRAQAGGKDASKVPEAIATVAKAVTSMLG